MMSNDEIDQTLQHANKLHPNMTFTLEKVNNGIIPFLDMLVTIDENQNLSTARYAKPTDTGLSLRFRSLAPTRYERNTIEDTVHRIHNATSNWSSFNEGLMRAKDQWEKKQNPPAFYEHIVNEVIEKLLTNNTASVAGKKAESKREELLIMQYRGNISDNFAKQLKKMLLL